MVLSASYWKQAFKGRLLEIIDQAQHFAALGHGGPGGSSGSTAQAFREGLDATERERKMILFHR
jgi:GINS complex subunit 3